MSQFANPLEQLQDIIEPTAPSFWPLPLIYWLFIVIAIGVIALSVYLYKKQKHKQQKLKQAFTTLQQLQNKQANFIELNTLLKGVALQYFPRQQIASLHGLQWFNFIQQYSNTPLFGDAKTFTQRLYQAQAEPCSELDYSQSLQWIKEFPKQVIKTQGEQ